jgi:carbonyl reductase 1
MRRAREPIVDTEDGAKIPLRLAFKDIGNTSGRFWENDSISSTAEGKIREW